MVAQSPGDGDGENPELLRVHLRGGQTIEMVVTRWSLKKHGLSNELTELTWSSREARMPYIRLDSVDAVTAHLVAPS